MAPVASLGSGEGAVRVAPGPSFRRLWLDEGSWVDVAREWLEGADALYRALAASAPWRQGRMWRYETWVSEPRLTASVGRGSALLHPVLADARSVLRQRYRVELDAGTLSWYRDGRDGLAAHRDRELRYLDDTVVAVLTLGGPRPFVITPRGGGDARQLDLAPARGDLLVMGGRCQANWLHAVPVQAALGVPGRISVQWRWTSRRGRPEEGPSYRAPRSFSS